MVPLDAICGTLAQIAPLRLAESWDNVGLLVGDRRQSVTKVMTCLTVTPCVVDEAIGEQADLIVVHHPLPFQPLKKITSDSVSGAMLLKLIAGNVAVYSAHTAFDSAVEGINQMWAERLGLQKIEPLVPVDSEQGDVAVGAGRIGRLEQPTTLAQLIHEAAASVGATLVRKVGERDQAVTKVALACGSGGSFLAAAKRRGCDAMITGEATFHACLEAESNGIGLGLLGHYWSERFAMERLADRLSGEFPPLTIWPSRDEHDPISPLDR
ncbi:MAG: Nif3-like dinuclear metal center hexameric protein [Rubripirellula sp.]